MIMMEPSYLKTRRNHLYENREGTTCQAMLDLISVEKASCYLEFETCTDINRIFTIQGRLKALQEMEDYILKPLPNL